MMFKVERNDISENFHKGNNGRTTDKIAEQKIRTQRFLGQLLKEKEVSKNSQNQYTGKTDLVKQPDQDQSLSDYGLSKYESRRGRNGRKICTPIFGRNDSSLFKMTPMTADDSGAFPH
jgi:hypothetical protein